MLTSKAVVMTARALSVCAIVLNFVSAQQRAVCVLTPTLNNSDQSLTGIIHFTQPSGNTEASVEVSYTIYGLQDGPHKLRVNEFGTMHSTDGSATGGIFQGDCNQCRPNNVGQTIGNLRNGNNIRSQGGLANGTFTDVAVRLVGVNSIIGRSVVVLGNEENENARVAQCVVGRNNDEDEVTDDEMSSSDGVTIADCLIAPTIDGDGTECGHARFEVSPVDGTVGVSLYLTGLGEDGVHSFHIHDRGNIDPLTPSSQGNHFVGNFTTGDQATSGRTEVGQLGGDNSINSGVGARGGIASVTFVDSHVKLNETNSIVGRSLVIHRPSDGVRVAHCVIGIQQEALPDCEGFACLSISNTGSSKRVLRALAVMTPASDSGVSGTVELTESPDGSTLDLRYFFTGLSTGIHRWHIHMYGDTNRVDGRSTGNHFVGECVGCRTFPNPFEVGYIGDGQFIIATNGTSVTKAYGTITDTEIKLNGDNSVVGRSIVVHGDERDPAIRVAQGVIGRTRDAEVETRNEPPIMHEGMCRFEPTQNDASFDVAGYVAFSLRGNTMQLMYNISGLTPGDHAWHVHEWGHMIGAHDAMSTGGHFVGEDIDRPGEAADEVGNIGDGMPLSVDTDGRAVGLVVDRYLRFSEMNSVVGRSVVIREVGGSAREAMCVIGIANTNDDTGTRVTTIRNSGTSTSRSSTLFFLTVQFFFAAELIL